MKYLKITLLLSISLSKPLMSQSLQEIQKLQEEYKKVLDKQSLQKPADISDAEKTVKSTVIPDKLVYSRKDIESLLVNTEKLLQRLQFFEDSVDQMPYFGYDFFIKRDSIAFWQNLPIPKNYILGSGDEIIISLWGESNSYLTERINKEGQVFVDEIGMLNLGGKSVENAKNYIISKYSRVYSTLLGNLPKSFIDLTLGELKSVNVNFAGFVNIPGVHVLHPFSNVVTGLIQAGGVDVNGSLREIKVYRDNQVILNVDLYEYLIEGKSFDDMRLMDQDMIFISPRKSTIPITGKVLRPGYYEAIEKETLHDLIKFTGGMGRNSSKYILINKNDISSQNGFMVDYEDSMNLLVTRGDSIHIPLQPDFENFVYIQGQVKNPGEYPFNSKMNLNDLLSVTMSLDIKDYYETMDLSNISVMRKNPSGHNPIIIKTNFDENILLKNGDHINIPKKLFFKSIESVIISGEIKTPGIYPVNNITTLSDILNLSGGYTDLALIGGIQIFRDSLNIGWENESFILKDGDSLNVLKKSGLILIQGEVNVPGYISHSKNTSVGKYIKRAGGFTSYADMKNIFIMYPNGISTPLRKWPPLKVEEGSTIIVNQRSLSRGDEVSGWQTFSMISGQATNIATTIISLSLLINQSNSGN